MSNLTTETRPAPPAGVPGEGRRGADVRRAVLVIVLYLVLALLLFSPISPFDNTKLPIGGVGDAPQMAWFLEYTPWALLHGHNPFVTNYLDYPAGVNLASNTSAPLLGVLLAPVTLGLGPIAALNLALRLALFSSASSMFLVLRRWCRSPLTAAIGGLVYGFGPYLATHLHAEGHLNLVFVPIPPLLALGFDDAFVSRRHRAVPVGIGVGLAAAAQLLISPEVLSDAAILGAVALVGLAAAFPREVRRRLAHGARAAAGAAVTFGLLAAWPLYEMLAGPGHLRGPLESVTHLQSFRTDLLEPFLPGPSVLLAPAAAVRAAARATAPILAAGGSAEVGGYLGIPLVILLVVLVVRQRRDKVVVSVGALTVVALLGSLGGRLEVDGHVTGVPLPEAILGHLPVLDNTIPARFGLYVALFAAMTLAIGLDRALVGDALTPAARSRLPVAVGLVALTAASVLALLPRAPIDDERPALAPGVAATLAREIPNGAVVLAYPYPDPPFDVAMLWQAGDEMGFRLMGGYATVNGRGTTGQFYPPLLRPPYVQEELTAAEAGRPRHYPAPLPGTDGVAALCRYLGTYAVGAVVYAPAGPGTTTVERLFTAALGKPSATGSGLEIWRLQRSAPYRPASSPSCG